MMIANCDAPRAEVLDSVDRQIILRRIDQAVPGEITISIGVRPLEGMVMCPYLIEQEELDDGTRHYTFRLFVSK